MVTINFVWRIKMKKKYAIMAGLLSVTMLTGCGTIMRSPLSANWYEDTSITNAISGTYEKMVYDVTFQKSESNNSYSVTYTPGVYTTELTNDIYTWTDGTSEEVYKLTSSLVISGEYAMDGVKVPFSDSVSSITYFRPVTAYLAPIYTEKHVHSTSPAGINPVDAEHVCVVYDYSNYISYEKDLTSATVTTVNHANKDEKAVRTYELGTLGTIFDNEILVFGGRSVNFVNNNGTNTSLTVSVLSPEVGKVQTVTYTHTNTEKKKVNWNGSEVEINTATVALSLNETFHGASQVYVYASKVAGLNTYRNALVSMQTFLSYNLGSLNYTLKEAVVTTK